MSQRTSNERQSILKKAGFAPGDTFLPAQELSKLQAGILTATKNVQEKVLLEIFPHLIGKNFDQITDWMNRNSIAFQCVSMTKPDPAKILNCLTYVVFRENPELKYVFNVYQEIVPVNSGGFMASVSYERTRWPDDLKVIKA